jgi:hypothetical protein
MSRPRPWIALLLAACALPCAAQLRIDFPAPPFDTFAESRDFYVRGSFPATVRKPGNVKVELFRGGKAEGEPCRVLTSQVGPDGTTPASSVETSYSPGKAWDGVDAARVPDLIKEPGGIENPENKVIVTRTYFAAEILGGVTKTFNTSYRTGQGAALKDLEKGTYTVKVTGLSGELAGLTATATVRMEYAPKLLGRFGPEAHKAKLLKYAQDNNLRVLTDPFPGFFKPEPAASPSYEIVARWSPNNAEEVVNLDPGAHYGTPRDVVNHLVLYNISAACATEKLEICALQRASIAADPNRTRLLRYDLGEPELFYLDESGQQVKRDGTLVALEAGKRLAVARIETGLAEPGRDNEFNAAERVRKQIVPAGAGRVELPRTGPWVVYGVVPPIPSQVTPDSLGAVWFNASNHVKRVHYELVAGNGSKVFTADLAVGLVRQFSTGAKADPSLYEFKHVLQVPGNLGTGAYQLLLTGYDTQDKACPEVTGKLDVTVRP